MRLDGSIVRYQSTATHHAEPKSNNWKIYDHDDDVDKGKTPAKIIHVTDLISQKQLPDTLHLKANVILLSPFTETFS